NNLTDSFLFKFECVALFAHMYSPMLKISAGVS
ncbi:MAG: hypothetical protein ACJAR0_003611, partial [Candidatus Azotimanducaceae bacterium]